MNKPVLLFAFANEREEGQRYLRNLPLEMNRLRAALEKAEDKGLCELVILPNTTLDTLISTFQREKYRNRIALFHYGGHAGSYELLLEQNSGKTQAAHSEGVIPFLAAQKGLQLIFLNGCHSARQAESLIHHGIPAVVGTVSAVEDRIATELASAFYQALGEGMPLEQAWQEATFKIKASEAPQGLNGYYHQPDPPLGNRDVVFNLGEPIGQFPWDIHFRPGAEAIRDWNLPDAAQDPYFGLPNLPARYGFPEAPYRFLERYKKEDARIFFGRGSYIRDLYHRTHSAQAAPVLLLYGQSGVGKSSLLEAGLFPRLEEDYDIRVFRRQPEIGLLGHLTEALDMPAEEPDAAQLLQQWKQLETQSEKKGIVIVLDQVEEVFTRPNEKYPEELDDFLQAISAIFARPDERPRGKLLLSYRKEYDPEIEKACRAAGVPKEKVFLERLDRKGVVEIIGGLASGRQLQNKYRLKPEKGLTVLVADDLLEDRNSPIAPVLQIILTKLWQEQAGQDSRLFRAEYYQKLKKEGILLDDFFYQQMAQIRAWEEELEQQVESSGLALDVLHYHTTALGTAESRSLETLRTHYQHQSNVLQQLIQQLQSLYLLAGLGPEQTALAHDTLAPIVQKEIRDSDKPGQRALRILSSKMADYAISPERTYIDEEDLALVEDGAGGMRIWTGKERELVEKSRERRVKLVAERRRNRRLKRVGVVVITLLALVASLLGWRSNTQSTINRLVSEALQSEKTDATVAMRTLKTAFQKINSALMPVDELIAIQARHDIYSDNEFYYREFPADSAYSAPVQSLCFSPDGALILAAVGNEAVLRDTAGTQKLALKHEHIVNSVAFSPDGQSILTTSDDQSARLWSLKGQPIHVMNKPGGRIKAGVFSRNGKYLLIGNQKGGAALWDAKKGQVIHQWKAHRDSISSLTFLKNENLMATGGMDGLVHLWKWTNGVMIHLDSFSYASKILSLACDPIQNTLLAGGRDGTAWQWSLDDGRAREIKCHSKRINSLSISSDGRYFLTASDDKQVKLWPAEEGNLIKTYKGHNNFVNAVALSPDGQYFVSGGEEGKIKLWKRDSKVHRMLQLDSLGVSDVAFSPDGEFVLLGSAPQRPYSHLDLKGKREDLDESEAFPKGFPAFIWRLSNDQLDTLHLHTWGISSVAISSDSKYCLTGGIDGVAAVWDSSGALVKELHDVSGGFSVRDVAFIPGQPGAITLERNSDTLKKSEAYLWDFGQEEMLYSKLEINEILWLEGLDISLTPSGVNVLLAGRANGKGRIEMLDISKVQGQLQWSNFAITELALDYWCARSAVFSPDGAYFATGEGGRLARLSIFQTKGLQPLSLANELAINAESLAGGRTILSIAFSHDGRYVLAGAEGGLAVIFDLESEGQPVVTYRDFEGYDVSSVAFFPNTTSTWILIGSRDGKARVYPNVLANEAEAM